VEYCSECGHKLASGMEKFCPECGQKLTPSRGAEGIINVGNTSGDIYAVPDRRASWALSKVDNWMMSLWCCC